MGSGKSHIGRSLAKLLTDYRFVDLDAYILEKSGEANIQTIFQKKGEAYFRILESSALQDSLAFQPAIIATGGGTACFADNISWMNAHGLTVFLNPAIETLYQRLLKGRKKRPLIAELDDNALCLYIQNLLEQRLPYYHDAKIRIDANQEAAVLAELLAQLKLHSVKDPNSPTYNSI